MNVSVICTFLNAERTLAATLESLYTQHPVEARFILVDDGSSDESAVIAERYAKADARFRLLANARPGRIHALNLALGQADTECVAVLDADDIAHPAWLNDGLVQMRREPRFAVIGFERLFIHDLAEPDWMVAQQPDAGEVRDVTRRLARGNAIGHSGSIMRRACLVEVGGYDESLSHVEDYDLWVRLAQAGYALGLSNLVRVAKRYHDDQKFGHAPRVLWASWRTQLRAVVAIDRSFQGFLSLGWFGLRELTRKHRRTLAAWADRH